MKRNMINPDKKVRELSEYFSLQGAKQRCYYKNHPYYYRYGGRGIVICDRWLEHGGIWNLVEDIGYKPTPKHTLERRDNDGNYCPDNCYWATRQEQARNRGVRKDNKVGVPGINWDKTHCYWVVRKVDKKGKRICLGRFKELEDAKQVISMYGLL